MSLYRPMFRQAEKLTSIRHPAVKETLQGLIYDVDNLCHMYFSALALHEVLSKTNAAEIIGKLELTLSNDFGDGQFTTSVTLSDVLSKAAEADYLVDLRNQIVVGFCNAFEKAVVALLDACRISYGDSEPRYSCYRGGTYDTAAINKWLKVYNVLLKPLPESDYFCMAVGSHSANYMQGLFWARNRIVHHGAICNTKQVTEDGSIWGCRAVGDKIKTSHNKIDDIAQFLDNNICFIFQDVDRVLP